MAIESRDNLSISERDTLFASTLLKTDADQNERIHPNPNVWIETVVECQKLSFTHFCEFGV